MKLLVFIFEHPSYLYPLFVLVKLVSEFDGIGCVCSYMSQLPFMRLKGYSSQKSIDFLLNPFYIN